MVSTVEKNRMASAGQTDRRNDGVAHAASERGEGAEERFTFFFGAESPFSQWHRATFTVEGVKYNCAEQYMMHQKAGEALRY